jgi:hypothetical protein
MPHFAKLDENNVVIFVTVGREEDDGKEEQLSQESGDLYRQTSYNTYAGEHRLGGTPYRKNYAGLGYTYDQDRDAFIPPKPFDSWILDEETAHWKAPVPAPEDGVYSWDEETLSWKPGETYTD